VRKGSEKEGDQVLIKKGKSITLLRYKENKKKREGKVGTRDCCETIAKRGGKGLKS